MWLQETKLEREKPKLLRHGISKFHAQGDKNKSEFWNYYGQVVKNVVEMCMKYDRIVKLICSQEVVNVLSVYAPDQKQL